MNHRLAKCIFAFLFLGMIPVASAQDAKARASLSAKECWVGERVTLVVELLAPGYFAGAPNFDLPDPPGMMIVPPQGSPTLGTETIDGVSYTVQRHELSVFAHRDGPQTMPPLTIRIHFKRNPLDKEPIAATVKTEPLNLTAKRPPGSGKLGVIISARDLTAAEEWKPEPGKAKTGDAFTRTITFTAPDVPAMAFPPFPAHKIDGLGIYTNAPEVEDQTDRGNLRGQRRETITYVCQRPGQFVVPPVHLSWFDLDAKKVQVIEFPSRTFDVSPNPAMQSGQNAATTSSRTTLPSLSTIAITLACLALMSTAIFLTIRNAARWMAPFKPVHLAPLNPTAGQSVKTIIAFSLTMMTFVFSARAQTDPLPSWNDGRAKSAITSFVDRVTKEGSPDFVKPEDRIVVFDNDGTLWCEQPMYFQGLFAFDRIKALARQHPEWQSTEPFKSILNNDMKGVAAAGDKGLMQVVAETHAGMTTDEFNAIVKDWIKTARHPKFNRPYNQCIYQPMLEVLNYLRANGVKTFIVSGGGVEFMRAFAEQTYGIPPEQVIGSRGVVKFDIKDGKPVLIKEPKIDFIDDGPGKPVAINNFIGRRPIMAFGNSDGDQQMLEWTTAGDGPRFALLVHHTDADREYAYDRESHVGKLDKAWDEAMQKGWTVVDMKSDWKTVFPAEKGQAK
jgi:phosphoglycolate phosphatase-like HAD superfamily hydrolase